jgi:replication fork clamp-binding protein CrfC
MHHIRATLPDIKSKIQSSLLKYQNELNSLGGPMGEGSGGNVILQIITEFCTDYRTAIDGNSQDLSLNELSGGARISFVFHELFSNGVKAIDPSDQVKDADIRIILYNSSGSSPALFVGTTAFEVIIKQQIKRLEDPSLKCANLVYDELVRILTQLLNKHVRSGSIPVCPSLIWHCTAIVQEVSGPQGALLLSRHCPLQAGHEPDQQACHGPRQVR